MLIKRSDSTHCGGVDMFYVDQEGVHDAEVVEACNCPTTFKETITVQQQKIGVGDCCH